MGQVRLTTEQFRWIEWHNRKLLESAEKEVVRLEQIPRRQRPEWVTKQLIYWKHAVSTLRWSTEIARQRLGKDTHGSGATV